VAAVAAAAATTRRLLVLLQMVVVLVLAQQLLGEMAPPIQAAAAAVTLTSQRSAVAQAALELWSLHIQTHTMQLHILPLASLMISLADLGIEFIDSPLAQVLSTGKTHGPLRFS
jgi:hypothetical protein